MYTCILLPVIASKVLILVLNNHCNKCSLCSKYPYYKEKYNFCWLLGATRNIHMFFLNKAHFVVKNHATDFSVSRLSPKSKRKLHLTKAGEFKASKKQRVDSSNVDSTSNELSSDQLPTFEELSSGQPSTLDSHSLLENCLLVNLLHQLSSSVPDR